MLERETPNSADPAIKKLWDMKESLPHYKLAIKQSEGTETTLRVECTFAKAFKIDKVARCIYDPAVKLQWDDSVEIYEKDDLFDGASNLLLYFGYMKAKKMLGY